MTVEDRLVDALSEFDRVEPSPDLYARVEASVERDREHRRRVARSGAGALAAAGAVVAALWAATDAPSATVPGWAVFAAQLVTLSTIVIVLGRVIPRFGQVYVADVFRLDPSTASRFLRLQDVAYHLVFAGYVVILAWHREMAGRADVTEAVRFLLDRVAGLLLLMGLLHAVTLLALPVLGLVFGTTVRDHARALAGDDAPPPTPEAVQAARVGRVIVWIVAALVVVASLIGVGLLAGMAIAGA